MLILQVMVLNSKRKVSSIPPPSITIFARHQKIGWKSRPLEVATTKDILRHQCGGNSPGTLVECIKENTFDFEETVEDAYLRTYTKETTSLMDPRFWSTHFTAMRFGRGYTLRFPWNPSADFDQVILLLGHSMEYTIFIHDHEYFMVSENLLALSTLNVAFNPNQTFSHYERLLVTENQLLENCETWLQLPVVCPPGGSSQSNECSVSLLTIIRALHRTWGAPCHGPKVPAVERCVKQSKNTGRTMLF